MRIFLLSLFCLLSISPVRAAEEKAPEQVNSKEAEAMVEARKNLQSAVSENSFFSDEPAVIRPTCENARLSEKVLQRIKQYYADHKEISIVNQRRQALLLKNLNKFSAVPVSTFNPKNNYSVADRLIDIKINEGIPEEKISLCKSQSKENIYLLIYPTGSFYTVEIVNFPGQKNSKEFKTVYE